MKDAPAAGYKYDDDFDNYVDVVWMIDEVQAEALHLVSSSRPSSPRSTKCRTGTPSRLKQVPFYLYR